MVTDSVRGRPELARYKPCVVVAAMSTEAQHDRQVVVLLTIIARQQCQLTGEHVKTFLLSEHSDRNQVSKQTQVHTQLARVWHLTTHAHCHSHLVGWSLTSLFSANTAISVTKGRGGDWGVILLPSEGRLAIY